MTTAKFLPYAKQSISPEDQLAVSQSLTADLITRGPKVQAFEKAVADYCGAKHAIAYHSGTSALVGAAYAAKVGPGDRLISTPNTFVASVGCGVQRGATPVFVDVDPTTGNMDLGSVSEALQVKRSRGRNVIIPVHFAGVPVAMHSLEHLVKEVDTVIIEDAAHALGSTYSDGTKVGCCRYSDMTILSFHPAKNITTGEGGMVLTNNDALAERLKLHRNNGIDRSVSSPAEPWRYDVLALTDNYNFTDMQAALGLSQLSRLDGFVAKRKALMDHYATHLASVPHVKLLGGSVKEGVAYHICVVQIDFEAAKITRGETMAALQERGIGTQVHYIPVYRHPVFKPLCRGLEETLVGTEAYYSQALTLPLFVDLTTEDVERVCRTLGEVLAKKHAIR